MRPRGRRANVHYGTVSEQVFRLRTEAAHADTERGAVIVGIITAGIVRVGYPFDLHARVRREQSAVAAPGSLMT